FEQIFVRMGKQENRFFGVIYDLVGEAGLVIDKQGNTVFPRNIFSPHDREFIPGNIVSEMNSTNSSAGGRAANGDAVQHVRKWEVNNILRGASDLFPPLFSLHRFSDEVRCHCMQL